MNDFSDSYSNFDDSGMQKVIVIYHDGEKALFDGIRQTDRGIIIFKTRDVNEKKEYLQYGYIPNASIKEIKKIQIKELAK